MVSVRELIYLQLPNLRWGLICNSIVPQLIRIGQGYRAFDPRFDVISLYIYIYIKTKTSKHLVNLDKDLVLESIYPRNLKRMISTIIGCIAINNVKILERVVCCHRWDYIEVYNIRALKVSACVHLVRPRFGNAIKRWRLKKCLSDNVFIMAMRADPIECRTETKVSRRSFVFFHPIRRLVSFRIDGIRSRHG